MIRPLGGSWRRRRERPVVVFPQPDSPTSPSVSPLLRKKETLSTAFTTFFSNILPPATGKYCFRFWTSTNFLSSIKSYLPVLSQIPPSEGASRRCNEHPKCRYIPAFGAGRSSYRNHISVRTDILPEDSAYRPDFPQSGQGGCALSRSASGCFSEAPLYIHGTDYRRYPPSFHIQLLFRHT